MNQSSTKLLQIYLDDHAAGAAAGLSLARRMYQNNRKTEWADRLRDLADQIEEDERILSDIRVALGFDGGKAKRYLALAGERAARLKPNGRVVTYSPLSRLVECEAMEAGVSAKKRLWAALGEGPDELPELKGFDFEALTARAEDQISLLNSFHAHAAAQAFAD